MNTPMLSIIVPIYQVEYYLEECIESILKQKFEDYEVLLIDDGSTDTCPSICENYAKSDSRIKVIHQKNAGLGAARNTGLLNANGQWIFFVDSDDYICSGALETIAKNINEMPNIKLFVYRYLIEKQGVILPAPQKPFIEGKQETKNYRELLKRYNETAGWAVWKLVVHRSLILDDNLLLFLPKIRHGEDIYWVHRLLSRVDVLQYCDSVIYIYRVSRDGSLSNEIPQNMIKWLPDLEATFEWFMEHPEENNAEIIKENIAYTYLYYVYASASHETRKQWVKHFSNIKHIVVYTKRSNCGKKMRLIRSILSILPSRVWYSALSFLHFLLRDQ